MTVTSLRASKKDLKRRTLLEVSDRLFHDNGYEATTLEEICQLASVSMRTFFRYFESKQDLALYENIQNVGRIRDLLLNWAAETDLIGQLQELYETLGAEVQADPRAWLRVRLLLQEPTLVARSLLIDMDTESRIALAFTRQWGDAANLQSRLLATLIVGAARSALLCSVADGDRPQLVLRISQAFLFIRESGLDKPRSNHSGPA